MNKFKQLLLLISTLSLTTQHVLASDKAFGFAGFQYGSTSIKDAEDGNTGSTSWDWETEATSGVELLFAMPINDEGMAIGLSYEKLSFDYSAELVSGSYSAEGDGNLSLSIPSISIGTIKNDHFVYLAYGFASIDGAFDVESGDGNYNQTVEMQDGRGHAFKLGINGKLKDNAVGWGLGVRLVKFDEEETGSDITNVYGSIGIAF